MPKIAQYGQSQVGSQVVRQPRATAGPASPSIGVGVTRLAGALNAMGQRVDTTVAEDTLVQFEREKNDLFFNADNGYFNTQGQNAFEGGEAAGKALQDLQKKYEGSIESDRARQMFSKIADNHVTRGTSDIARHASKGAQVWELSTLGAQVENAVETSSLYWNQPKALTEQREIGRLAIADAAKLSGISAEALAEKLQTFDASVADAAITAATANSAADGRKSMDTLGKYLEGPDKINLTKRIETKTRTEKTQRDAMYAVTEGQRLVRNFDSREDIIAEVEKIKDVDVQKKVMGEAMSRFSLARRAESEAQVDAYHEAQDHVLLPGNTATTFQAQDPEGWERLSAVQKASLIKGKPVVTDKVLFGELMMAPDDSNLLKDMDPAQYADQLAKPDYDKLVKKIMVAREGGSDVDRLESATGRTRASETNLAAQQLFGKKSKWDTNTQKRVSQFYSLIDTEVAAQSEAKGGVNLTTAEYTAVVQGIAGEWVKSGFIFDSTRDLTDLDIVDIDMTAQVLSSAGVPITGANLSVLEGIPLDAMEQVIGALEANNREVSAENILSVYNQAR